MGLFCPPHLAQVAGLRVRGVIFVRVTTHKYDPIEVQYEQGVQPMMKLASDAKSIFGSQDCYKRDKPIIKGCRAKLSSYESAAHAEVWMCRGPLFTLGFRV